MKVYLKTGQVLHFPDADNYVLKMGTLEILSRLNKTLALLNWADVIGIWLDTTKIDGLT